MSYFTSFILSTIGLSNENNQTTSTVNLTEAVCRGDIISTKEAIENGADVNATIKKSSICGSSKSILTKSAQDGYTEITKLLLSHGAYFDPSDIYYYASPINSANDEIKNLLKSACVADKIINNFEYQINETLYKNIHWEIFQSRLINYLQKTPCDINFIIYNTTIPKKVREQMTHTLETIYEEDTQEEAFNSMMLEQNPKSCTKRFLDALKPFESIDEAINTPVTDFLNFLILLWSASKKALGEIDNTLELIFGNSSVEIEAIELTETNPAGDAGYESGSDVE